MTRVSKGITQFYLALTVPHTNHIPAFTPQPHSVTAFWLVLIVTTHFFPR